VERYLDVLEQTFVIRRVTPFARSRRQEIVKSPKVFFLDAGLRNMALELHGLRRAPDRGQLSRTASSPKNLDLELSAARLDFILLEVLSNIYSRS